MGMYIYRIIVLLVCFLICLFLDMVDFYWRRKNIGLEMYVKYVFECVMLLDVKEMGLVWVIFNRYLLVLFNC